MKLVVDTNILIASLIKNSTCRKIILSDKFSLFTPIFSINEVERYEQYICNKSGINSTQFYDILSEFLDHIYLIKDDIIKKYLKEADNIIGNFDKKDVAFVAAALAVKGSYIWSDDKDFEK